MRTRLIDRIRSTTPPSANNPDSTSARLSPDLPYYRPTLHHFWVFHWAEASEKVFEYIAQALQHLAPMLPADAQDTLRDELEAKRGHEFKHDIRFPFVRSERLYPVPNQDNLCVAFYAYQDGPDMLLHFIWYLNDKAPASHFIQQAHKYLWSGPQTQDNQGNQIYGRLGESVLLTAVIENSQIDQLTEATQLIQHVSAPESHVSPLSGDLNGAATLYMQSQIPLNQTRSGAILFYGSRFSCASAQADQFVTIEWPLITLYQLRIERLYLKRYRANLRQSLIQQNRALRQVLNKHFAAPANQQSPHLFTKSNLKSSQNALKELSGPQYHQLECLNEAEAYAQEAQLELQNLTQTLKRKRLRRPQLATHHLPSATLPGTRRKRHRRRPPPNRTSRQRHRHPANPSRQERHRL